MSGQEKSAKRFLRGQFKGVVLKYTAEGDLVIDTSQLSCNTAVNLITANDANFVKLTHGRTRLNEPLLDRPIYSIGSTLPDGWIVGPLSPKTGSPIAIEPSDYNECQPGFSRYNSFWDTGKEHADFLKSKGHLNARLPDEDEILQIYQFIVESKKNQLARFETAKGSLSTYWSSSSRGETSKEALDFSTGLSICGHNDNGHYSIFSIRCIRDEPDILIQDYPGLLPKKFD